MPDKFRIFCCVIDKEKAIELYKTIARKLAEPLKCSIFLDFPEEIFVKHADLAAKKYEE